MSTGKFGVVLDGIATVKKNGEDAYLEMAPAATTVANNRVGMYLVARASANGSQTALENNYFKADGLYTKEGYVLAMDASLNAQAVDPEATVSYNSRVFGSYNSTRLAQFSGGAVAKLGTYYAASVGGINVSPAYTFNEVDANGYNKARQVVSAAVATSAVADYKNLNYKLYDLDNGKYVGKQADPSKVSWYAYTQLAVQTVSSTEGTGNVKINLTDFAVFYAKAMEVLDTQFDEDAAKLTIAMTDAIDPATAVNLVITKDGVALAEGAFETACNEEERTIEVTFPLGLKAGDYSVSLANVEPKNGLYDGKATTSFTVENDSLKLGITGVTSNEVALGNTIDADAGEITIEFSDTLTDGAADQIALTKANGDEIAGKVIKTQDGATVTFRFGRLDEGVEYKLDVPGTLVSASGAVSTAKTYTFTATREYEVKNDFSGFEEGAQLRTEQVAWGVNNPLDKVFSMTAAFGYDATLSTNKIGVALDGAVTVKKNGDDTYLEMAPATTGLTSGSVGMYLVPKNAAGTSWSTWSGQYFKADANGVVSEKTKEGYVLAMDVSVNAQAVDPEAKAAYAVRVHGGYPETALAQYAGSTGAVGALTNYWNPSYKGIEETYKFNTVGENEFNTARQVISTPDLVAANTTIPEGQSAVKAAMNLTYKLYDLDNGKYVGKQADATKYTWDMSARLAAQKIDAAAGTNNVKVNITDFAVFYAKAMYVLDTQFDSNDYVVTIALSDEIDAATADNLTVTVDGAAINPATYDVACNDEERTIEITFPYGLKMGVYNVSLAGVEPKNGLSDGSASTSFEVTQDAGIYMANFGFEGSVDGVEFLELVSGEAGEGQLSIGDATQIKVSAEIGGADDAAVFLAVYDEDYNLVDVVKVTGNAGVYEEKLTGLEAGKVKHASMYIWQDLNTLKPLFKPLQCL